MSVPVCPIYSNGEVRRHFSYHLTFFITEGNFWAPYVSGPTLTLCVVSSRFWMTNASNGFGWMMVHVCGCALSIAIMFGRMILCITEPMMAGRSEHWTFWMNTVENVWRSGWNGSWTRLRSSTLLRACSSCEVFLPTSVQITALSSLLRLSEAG